MSQDAALGSIVDELLTCIATYLPDAASLIAFESVSSRFASVPHEAAWRSLCEKRWEDKPRYRLTEKRHEELNTHMRALSWRRRFATFEVDGRRSSITYAAKLGLQPLASRLPHRTHQPSCPALTSAVASP